MSVQGPSDPSSYPSDPSASGQPPSPYGEPAPYGQAAPPPYQGPPAAQPPVPYGGPQVAYVMPMPKNDLAIWSLVTGILSWIMCPLVLGVAAIVTGHASRKAVREGQANNVGAATAGLILGWLNVVVVVGGLLIWLIFAVLVVGAAGFGTVTSAG